MISLVALSCYAPIYFIVQLGEKINRDVILSYILMVFTIVLVVCTTTITLKYGTNPVVLFWICQTNILTCLMAKIISKSL
ncbi:hypothetical protein P19_0246 [Aeromonas phage P19]|uniref:Uncharacterized protein n=1 Tax=Aeromonas phage vB_AdhaM_G2 TaxID=3238786 RepID=A0AB39U099_9CAUD|nr:hypothetical protein P19_0246 [Aeromonas phage P19]